MERKDGILFISNGYGEDTIACSIVERLIESVHKERVLGFPLVGEGKAYSKLGVGVAVPTQNMPSGGLIPGGWVRNLWKDFTAGLGKLISLQIKRLKELRKETGVVVAVGDTYPVIMGGLFTGKPVIFVGTAKSNYFYPYSSLERAVFKRFCRMVFPRDEITAQSLRDQGIEARWVGNAMMDSLTFSDDHYGIPEDHTVIALLPGSRDFAYADFPIILKAVEIISREYQGNISYLAPLANSIELDRLGEWAQRASFTLSHKNRTEGVVGKLYRNQVEIQLLRNRFGDSINLAKLVIGQAGTGNEQAVGLGKPVISFDSAGGEKLGWYRLRQKGLLGDSLAITPRDSEDIAEAALGLLNNREEYDRMAAVGRERMGPPGGAQKMADYIAEFVKSA